MSSMSSYKIVDKYLGYHVVIRIDGIKVQLLYAACYDDAVCTPFEPTNAIAKNLDSGSKMILFAELLAPGTEC